MDYFFKDNFIRIKKRLSHILVTGLLSMQILSSFFVVSYADNIAQMQQEEQETQNAISSLEKETEATRNAISSLQEQKQQSEKNVSNLQSKSASLSSTYNDYSNQLDTLDGQINETEEKLRATSNEIVALYAELEENRRLKDELYAMLKKQIKNAYESGTSNSLALTLLTSNSVKDFLNRAEYVSAIVDYQQKQLAKYMAIEEKMTKQAEELEAKQAELDAYQDSLDEKQSEIEGLAYTVKSELNSTNSTISSEKSKLAEYEEQLQELDKKMKALESQVAAAQAKLAQQIAARLAATNREDTSGSYYATGSELEWLAATIQAEAGGESYTGKLAVGSVIMNRVMSSSFPNTIQGVITQNMQFASYRSGKVELIMARGPNSTCIQAANEVLNGARVGDYLFFMTKYYADYYGIMEYTMIGNHAFFYRWVTKPKEESQPIEITPEEDNSSSESQEESQESENETSDESSEESSDE